MAGITVLRVEGKVIGRWVEELRRAADAAFIPEAHGMLDLGGLTFADAHGVALLKELAGRGVRLVNCTAFTAAQLRSVEVGCERGRS